jgi:hypothetical protein
MKKPETYTKCEESDFHNDINQDRKDNRLCNLREVTAKQNLENKKRRYEENKTKCKNVNYDKNKAYYYKNIEKIKAYQAEYRKKQKEKKESC